MATDVIRVASASLSSFMAQEQVIVHFQGYGTLKDSPFPANVVESEKFSRVNYFQVKCMTVFLFLLIVLSQQS